jgi:hypothetical protein
VSRHFDEAKIALTDMSVLGRAVVKTAFDESELGLKSVKRILCCQVALLILRNHALKAGTKQEIKKLKDQLKANDDIIAADGLELPASLVARIAAVKS